MQTVNFNQANNLHELEGPFAIAVADTRKPNGIFMARNNNPVNFYRERNEGKLWFASTPTILAEGLSIEEDKTVEMPANKCVRIDSKAVAGKLKYHSIKRGPTSAIEYDLRRNSATQTTPHQTTPRHTTPTRRRTTHRRALDEPGVALEVVAGQWLFQPRELELRQPLAEREHLRKAKR